VAWALWEGLVSAEEKLKALTEVLKIVAWPAIVVWLIWYLRDEVKRAGGRLVELGLSGARFAPPPDQTPSAPQQGVPAIPSGSQPVAQPSGGSRLQQFIASVRVFLSDEVLEPVVQAVRADVPNKLGNNQTDQLEGLIYAVASVNIQVAHERTYNAIFGSQIQALTQMVPATGAPVQAIRSTYQQARSSYPEAYRAYTFEQWIGFLVNSGLCAVGQGGNYVLTPLGRGFLKYLVDMQRPPKVL
jgi:hypothetical protein